MGFERPPSHGLTSAEAARRLERYGANALAAHRQTSPLTLLLRQFQSALILVLIAGAAIAGFVGEIIDAIAILAIVLINAALGFVQEWRAERALDALRVMMAPEAVVLRDGSERRIAASQVVPGDVLVLGTGARIAADGVLAASSDLRVDESVLTGEAGSVAKKVLADLKDANATRVFAGTSVTHGHAKAFVTATGTHTEFGQIADLTGSVERKPTHLQRSLDRLGRRLAIFAIGLVLSLIAFGVAMGRGLAEMALTGISLAVAVVPEGLPAVVTVTLALGARAMVRRHALSRRLQAIETLGSASVICTDKTGTLTENQMTAASVWVPSPSGGLGIEVGGTGYAPEGGFSRDGEPIEVDEVEGLTGIIETGMICNNAQINRTERGWERSGEPTEAALVTLAEKAGVKTSIRRTVRREIPFSSERKRMSVVSSEGDGLVLHVKGAPDVIFELCAALPDGAEAAYRAMTDRGLRVLALARKRGVEAAWDEEQLESGLELLGLVGIFDPPRVEVAAAVRTASAAGIRTIMITGDAAGTALAIARLVGLDVDEAVEGRALAAMSDAELDDALSGDVVFARTAPAHKMRIVERLQAQDAIVAMTGDGVNDAPALKKADIGVAMGIRGTDVAKDAADIVLLDDNFASIVAAIEEGRRQFENVRKFVRYLLCSNGGEMVAIVANLMIGGPLIFQPIQILWMNLVTDGPTALTLGLEPAEADNMARAPRPAHEGVLDRTAILVIVLFSLYTGSASLWVFYDALEHGALYAQTLAFTTMILLEKFSVFAFRSLRLPMHRIGFASNPWLLAALSGTLGLHVAAIYWAPLQRVLHTTAIDLDDWLSMGVFVLPLLIVPEAVKIVRSRLI